MNLYVIHKNNLNHLSLKTNVHKEPVSSHVSTCYARHTDYLARFAHFPFVLHTLRNTPRHGCVRNLRHVDDFCVLFILGSRTMSEEVRGGHTLTHTTEHVLCVFGRRHRPDWEGGRRHEWVHSHARLVDTHTHDMAELCTRRRVREQGHRTRTASGLPVCPRKKAPRHRIRADFHWRNYKPAHM